MPDAPWILGLAGSHNGAACLLRGDEVVVAIQEERLTRTKRMPLHPARSARSVAYCLEYAGIVAADLDLVAYSTTGHHPPETRLDIPELAAIGERARFLFVSHHHAHAAAAAFTSGFDECAVLVVDGEGSATSALAQSERAVIMDEHGEALETISIYRAHRGTLTPLEKHVRPFRAGGSPSGGMPPFASLGEMFASASAQIFGSDAEAGKVMGLAPYGRPSYPVEDLLTIDGAGRFTFHDTVPGRVRGDERWPARSAEYEGLAAAVQEALERALEHLARRCRALSGSDRLAYAGGVALNSVANQKVLYAGGLFRELYIMPAAEDNGTAIGAAYVGLQHLTGRATGRTIRHDALGRPYSLQEVDEAISRVPALRVIERGNAVLDEAADLLCEGKILGWFQGRSEFGPRALGQRSILCDPRRPDAKDHLNARVKHREGFRPFAPAVLAEHAADWFEDGPGGLESPFMLRVCRFRPERARDVPAVVHVDGTGRIQTLTEELNGPLYRLVRAFHARTGVPILLNTSFNVQGEPIVETPEDALYCLLHTELDACVLEERLVTKAEGYRALLDLVPTAQARPDEVIAALADGVHTGWEILAALRADPRLGGYPPGELGLQRALLGLRNRKRLGLRWSGPSAP